jgi:CubicO group peptidase (beta-lactamase class C family)
MKEISSVDNPQLRIVEGNKSWWTHAAHRRHGWHHLPHIARYGLSFRSARVMQLEPCLDDNIAGNEQVRQLTSLPWFSAMIVVRGQQILFERYAADFGPGQLHSIQSITKTTINLIVGRLAEQGVLDLASPVSELLPEIGSGYANATLQQVWNMDVVNDYSEDFSDPGAMYYRHEEAMGWRLPRDPLHEPTERSFLPGISSDDIGNRERVAQYKDANTAVLGWVAERASGRSMRSFLAEIVDAAGLEDTFFITSDRDGVPTLEGGGCMSARDLARYFSIFVRRGVGIQGERVGSARFIDVPVGSGVPIPPPNQRIRYCNHLMMLDRCVGHGGWGGQYVLANLETGKIGVFFSVLENDHASDPSYADRIVRMLESVVNRS